MFKETSGATFSPCRRYRYQLWRVWEPERPVATFVMLNPSTADEVDNDPTVERCQRRAMGLGYGGLRVVNIFAFRSTDPDELYGQPDPIGPDNDKAILQATEGGGIVICAWGTHGKHLGRGESVISMLQKQGVRPHYLKLNQDGTPSHPLYLSYSINPKPFERADDAPTA